MTDVNDNPFQVAFGNRQLHREICEQLQQIRDRKVSDDNIQIEAAVIIEDAQKPLLDIIDQMEEEARNLLEL